GANGEVFKEHGAAFVEGSDFRGGIVEDEDISVRADAFQAGAAGGFIDANGLWRIGDVKDGAGYVAKIVERMRNRRSRGCGRRRPALSRLLFGRGFGLGTGSERERKQSADGENARSADVHATIS